MSSVLIIAALVVFVAVAVNAITCTLSGMILRTSPSLENSGRNVSPLHVCGDIITHVYAMQKLLGLPLLFHPL